MPRGVVRIAGVPPSWRQAVRIASLAAGAASSSRTPARCGSTGWSCRRSVHRRWRRDARSSSSPRPLPRHVRLDGVRGHRSGTWASGDVSPHRRDGGDLTGAHGDRSQLAARRRRHRPARRRDAAAAAAHDRRAARRIGDAAAGTGPLGARAASRRRRARRPSYDARRVDPRGPHPAGHRAQGLPVAGRPALGARRPVRRPARLRLSRREGVPRGRRLRLPPVWRRTSTGTSAAATGSSSEAGSASTSRGG